MRVAIAFFMAMVPWSFEANASSIVTIASTTEKLTPSMIALGTPASSPPTAALDPDVVDPPTVTEAAGPPTGPDGEEQLSPSVIALGEPAVTDETVAAIGTEQDTAQQAAHIPLVIRGGVPGDAFSSAASGEVTLTTGFDQQSDAKPPEAAKPADPAEAPEPAVAPEAPAPARPAEILSSPE